MKKKLIPVILFILLITISTACTSKEDNITTTDELNEYTVNPRSNLSLSSSIYDKIHVVLDGSEIIFDVDSIIDGKYILVPVRAIFEAYSMDVQWNTDTHTLTSKNDKFNVSVVIGENHVTVNDKKIPISTPAKIFKDRTVIPVDFFADGMDMEIIWIDTAQYIFINSTMEVLTYTNGKVSYKGQLNSQNERHGFGKEYSVKNEITYEGQWQNGIKKGIGRLIYMLNDSYEGAIDNNLPHGFGKRTYSKEGTYEGYFVNGIRNGYGIFNYNNGNKYAGEWTNDKQNGKGIMTYRDGRVVDSKWKNNKPVK